MTGRPSASHRGLQVTVAGALRTSVRRTPPLILGLSAGVVGGLALWAAHAPLALSQAAFVVAPSLVVAMRWVSGGYASAVGERVVLRPRTLLPALLAGSLGYGAMIAWLIAPAGLVGWSLLVAVQALWLVLWALLVAPHLHRPLLPLIAAAAWVGMDTLRGFIPLSGFSWGALAYSQVDVAWFVPLGRTLGASGVTFVIVGLSVALVDGLLAMRAGDREDPPRPPLVQAVGLALVTTLVTVGAPATEGTLDVIAVQGNDIEHWVERDPQAPRTITRNLHRLTSEAIAEGGQPDLVVWPESAVDRDPSREAWADLGVLASDAASAAGTLVTGVSLDGPDDPRAQRIVGAWQLDDGGTAEVADLYIKRRPVPFGEYVPGRRWLEWIPALDQVFKELEKLTGQRAVKDSFHALLKLAVNNHNRELRGDRPHQIALNRLFLGNPGTGKTTTAKLFGRLLKSLGLLSDGEVLDQNGFEQEQGLHHHVHAVPVFQVIKVGEFVRIRCRRDDAFQLEPL